MMDDGCLPAVILNLRGEGWMDDEFVQPRQLADRMTSLSLSKLNLSSRPERRDLKLQNMMK